MHTFQPIAAAPKEQEIRSGNLIPFNKSMLTMVRPFFLIHHPKSFEFVETDLWAEILPMTKDFRERAGVNGVREVQDRAGNVVGVDSSRTRTRLRDTGWFVIPRDFCPEEVFEMDDLPYQGYMIRWQTTSGWLHAPRWSVPDMSAGDFSWTTNWRQKWAWHRALVTRKLVPEATSAVLRKTIKIQRRRHKRNADKAHLPTYAARAEEAEATLTMMEEVAARSNGAVPINEGSTKPQIMQRLASLGIEHKAAMSKAALLDIYVEWEASNG